MYESRSSYLPDVLEESVKHVASMRLGGDVDRLETKTQEWVTELSPESKRLKHKMIGHRIILDTVARDSSTFAWYKILLSCIANAVEGRYFIRSFSLEIIMIFHIPNSRSKRVQNWNITS